MPAVHMENGVRWNSRNAARIVRIVKCMVQYARVHWRISFELGESGKNFSEIGKRGKRGRTTLCLIDEEHTVH
jgi:tRNA(Ile)-lysidine synthase TilS/MesJ